MSVVLLVRSRARPRRELTPSGIRPASYPVLPSHSLYHGRRQGARGHGLKFGYMTAPKGQTEANRALALGATIRRLRRDRRLTLSQLADLVPMSASNLSRIELGAQGPPPDETIQRIAQALKADSDELLRAAGRYTSGQSFEETVLTELRTLAAKIDTLDHDLRSEIGGIKAAIARRNTR